VAVNGSGVATTTTSFGTTGAHNLSAVFTPTDTSSFSASTGTFDLAVNPPATPTTTSLAVTQDGVAGHDVKLVATVSPSSAAGSAAFFDNGSATAIPGTVTQAPAGTYTLDLSSGLGAGGHSIVAKFSPTDVTQFQASQSAPQSFVLQPPASDTCARTPSPTDPDQRTNGCVDPQQIQVTVPAGSLVISTPYTDHALVLPDMHLTTNATMLTTSGTFDNIVVTDTRSGDLPYTISALCGPLSASATKIINGENVGLTNLNAVPSGGFAGSVTPHDNTAASPPVDPSDTGSAGLGGATAHAVLDTNHGLGTLTVSGTLTINAPTSTLPGTYTGTITFTVG
jgi:hypothetical protein